MFCAVIRSIGERTEGLCEDLVRAQFETVRIVENVTPGGAAIAESYRAGVASGEPWIVAIDADMLIVDDLRGQMEQIVQSASVIDWHWQASVDDRMELGQLRNGGPRLLRASFIESVTINEHALRPESDLYHRYPTGAHLLLERCWARHDYEQYYRDLYRKGAHQRLKRRSAKRNQHIRQWLDSSDKELRAFAYSWRGKPMNWPERSPL